MTVESGSPLIVYIPGLKPKPEPGPHRDALLRCLLAGIDRIDPAVAIEVAESHAFHLVSWTYDFYGEHRDIALDLPDIESVIAKDGPSEEDVVIATSWRRRFTIWLSHLANLVPFIIPRVATEEAEVHLRDFLRYVHDRGGCAGSARDKLKSVLRKASAVGRPVLLIAHSMGSVIAYESLWQLSREEKSATSVDLLLTTGSPLGQKIVQKHLLGSDRAGEERYPANIERWVNIAAIGELTAIDRSLRDDFSNMARLGLMPAIEDREVFNYYRMHGTLNVHAEYGYLVNEVTARYVSEWWRSRSTAA